MAAAHGGSMAGVDLSGARVRSGHIKMRHLGKVPSVHPKAYVAPNAVLSGEVSIGAASCVLHGAVLGAEGGPVQVGAGWVIMENAVLRGTLRRSLVMGDRVLAGPHAQLTGGGIAHEVFIAADAMVLSGARLGRVASVAVGAVVHLGAIVAPQAQIPTGWVAVGDPARALPAPVPEGEDADRCGVGAGAAQQGAVPTSERAAVKVCSPHCLPGWRRGTAGWRGCSSWCSRVRPAWPRRR